MKVKMKKKKRFLPLVAKIKKKKKRLLHKVASRWHSIFGLKGKEGERGSRAERKRDLFVSFVFLVD